VTAGGLFAELRGRVAIITGANRGLGRAIARTLDEAGVRSLLIGRDENLGRAAAAELADASFLAIDLRAQDAAEKIVSTCLERFGGLDILVNNAAIYPVLPFGKLTGSDVTNVYQTNAVAPTLLMQAAATSMIDRAVRGSIVNVISAAAFRPVATQLVYGSAKAALAYATRAAALELSGYGIRVNAISPGAMDHGEGGRASALGLTEEEYQEFVTMLIARIPLGRKAASREVAASVLFLCSSMASVVTGHILHCDGGETI
jgi:NAD(P)-dependent dehydrogenase (short-subunit alcohol dehydrogenase family)